MKKLGLLLAAVCLPALAHATVTSTASTASFTCTNATGPFPFTFPALDAGSLLVIEITTGSPPGVMTILTSSQWTSAPVNNSYANGGSVTLVSACPTGDTLVIARATEPTQLTHYTPNMPALYTNFENNLDQLTTGRQDSYRARQVYIGSVSGSGSASVTNTPLGQYLNILFPQGPSPGPSATGYQPGGLIDARSLVCGAKGNTVSLSQTATISLSTPTLLILSSSVLTSLETGYTVIV